jgi:hypothetical protein
VRYVLEIADARSWTRGDLLGAIMRSMPGDREATLDADDAGEIRREDGRRVGQWSLRCGGAGAQVPEITLPRTPEVLFRLGLVLGIATRAAEDEAEKGAVQFITAAVNKAVDCGEITALGAGEAS